MDFFDFITQDELDDLPDDPQAAFMQFASIAQRSLRNLQRNLDLEENAGWEELNEARHAFMNVMVAAAKRFDIEPFASMGMPALANFNATDHKQFKADLDHYVTQIAIGNTIRGRRDSVFIPATVKDRIRAHVAALRGEVEKAELGDAKRAALLDKLDKFQAELEKRRLTLVELTRITVAIAAVPGGVWASVDVTMKLVGNVMQAVGEAKATEDEERLLAAPAPMKALSPPRATKVVPLRDFSASLDDEIPF